MVSGVDFPGKTNPLRICADEMADIFADVLGSQVQHPFRVQGSLTRNMLIQNPADSTTTVKLFTSHAIVTKSFFDVFRRFHVFQQIGYLSGV